MAPFNIRLKRGLIKLAWSFFSCILFLTVLIATVVKDAQYCGSNGSYLREGKYVLVKYYNNFLFSEDSYVDRLDAEPDETNIIFDKYHHYCFHNLKSDNYYCSFSTTKCSIFYTIRTKDTDDDVRFAMSSENFDINFFIDIDGHELEFRRQK